MRSGAALPRGGLASWRLALLACLLGSGAAHGQEIDGSIGVSSGVIVRGFALDGGRPAVQGAVNYYGAGSWLASLSGAAFRLSSNGEWSLQLLGKLGYAWQLANDWGAQLSYVHYAYPLNSELRIYERDELIATATYRDRLVLSVAGLCNNRASARGSRSSVAYDLVGRYPLQAGVALSAGLGYQDMHHRSGFGYAYGNVGAGADLGRRTGDAHLEVSYIVTDATAKKRLGDEASNRWTASLAWAF